jgi:hypothetical protein
MDVRFVPRVSIRGFLGRGQRSETLQPRAHRSKSTGLSGSAMISPTFVEGVQAR